MAKGMTVREGLTLTDGDRLYDMLGNDVLFRECNFDGADFASIEANALIETTA